MTELSRPTVSLTDPAFHAVTVFPAETYSRSRPLIIDAPEGVRQSVQRNLGSVNAPAGMVARISNAVVLKRGVLVDKQHRVIKDSLINLHNAARFSDEVAPHYDAACKDPSAIQQLPDGAYVMLKQTWDGNFGHWLIESLPRIEMVRREFGVSGLTFIVSDNTGPLRKVYLDTLAMFGVGASQVLHLSDVTRRIADVIYPSPMTVQPWVKSPQVIRILEALQRHASDESPRPEKLFVSRNGWSQRRLLNEDAVVEMLNARGYLMIQPETLDIAQQIALFSQARLVIGSLGAALSNIVFGPRGVKLLALTTEHMGDDFFWDLAALKDGYYTSLHGTASEHSKGMQSDFTIDVDKLGQLLVEFESRSSS